MSFPVFFSLPRLSTSVSIRSLFFWFKHPSLSSTVPAAQPAFGNVQQTRDRLDTPPGDTVGSCLFLLGSALRRAATFIFVISMVISIVSSMVILMVIILVWSLVLSLLW